MHRLDAITRFHSRVLMDCLRFAFDESPHAREREAGLLITREALRAIVLRGRCLKHPPNLKPAEL